MGQVQNIERPVYRLQYSEASLEERRMWLGTVLLKMTSRCLYCVYVLALMGPLQMRKLPKAKALRHPQDAFISMLVTIWKALLCLYQKGQGVHDVLQFEM